MKYMLKVFEERVAAQGDAWRNATIKFRDKDNDGYIFCGIRESTNGAEALRHLDKVREYEEKRSLRVASYVALFVCVFASWSGRLPSILGVPAVGALVWGIHTAAQSMPSRPVESYTALSKIPSPGCFGEIHEDKAVEPGGHREMYHTAAVTAVGTLSNWSSASWHFLRAYIVGDQSADVDSTISKEQLEGTPRDVGDVSER